MSPAFRPIILEKPLVSQVSHGTNGTPEAKGILDGVPRPIRGVGHHRELNAAILPAGRDTGDRGTPRRKKETPYQPTPEELAEAIKAAAWLATVKVPDGFQIKPFLTVTNGRAFTRSLLVNLAAGKHSPTTRPALHTARALRAALRKGQQNAG